MRIDNFKLSSFVYVIHKCFVVQDLQKNILGSITVLRKNNCDFKCYNH